MSASDVRYGHWTITYDPPPIPIRSHDWQFWHDDYDGPGARRRLSGSAASVEDAIAQIREIEDEWEDE